MSISKSYSATFPKFVFFKSADKYCTRLLYMILKIIKKYRNEIFKNWPLFVFVVKYLFEVPATEVLTTVVTDIST